MKIRIEYKLKTQEAIETINLEPTDYLDGEIAKYGDTIEYVLETDKQIKKNDVEFTLLTISESADDKTERVTYFRDENELRYTKDASGWELIVQTIQVATNCIVVTRMERDNGARDWKNISYSTFLDPFTKNEIFYSALKGEYLKTPINK